MGGKNKKSSTSNRDTTTSSKTTAPTKITSTSASSSSSSFHYPDLKFSTLPRRDPFAYRLEEVCPGVLVVDDILTNEECTQLRNACSSYLQPTNPKNSPPKKGEAFRNNERFLHENFEENQTFAHKFWSERLKPIICSERNRHLLVIPVEERQKVIGAPIKGGGARAASSIQNDNKIINSIINKEDDETIEVATEDEEFLDPTIAATLPIGLNADFKFYRYLKGTEFAPHVDEPVRCEIFDNNSAAVLERTVAKRKRDGL